MTSVQATISKEKSGKKMFIILFLVILFVVALAGLTKAGYIPNVLGIDMLCSENVNNSPDNAEDWVAAKPVIYLYPQQKRDVRVQLRYRGKLIADYPKYDERLSGWEVTAYPDGKIVDHSDRQEYSYLFWEGEPRETMDWDFSSGFVVKGEDTRSFLRDKLSQIGLTPKEYNEFIVYWYPKLQNNKYNLIHFAGERYTDLAPLMIDPAPDSLLRVFMVYKPLEYEININEQKFMPFERNGFTVVEWGGTRAK